MRWKRVPQERGWWKKTSLWGCDWEGVRLADELVMEMHPSSLSYYTQSTLRQPVQSGQIVGYYNKLEGR